MGNKRKIQIKTIKWIKNAEIICGIKKIIKKRLYFILNVTVLLFYGFLPTENSIF